MTASRIYTVLAVLETWKLVTKTYLAKFVCPCHCFTTSKDLVNLGSVGTSISAFHYIDMASCWFYLT